MEAEMMVVMAVVAPLVVFPVALVWYLNIGGIISAMKEAGRRLFAD